MFSDFVNGLRFECTEIEDLFTPAFSLVQRLDILMPSAKTIFERIDNLKLYAIKIHRLQHILDNLQIYKSFVTFTNMMKLLLNILALS